MMGRLTPKQEKFCLKYIETGNASEAYRRSYNAANMKAETVNRNAKAMLDDNKIAARLGELRKPVMDEHRITVDSLLIELERARQAALTATPPQASAAVAATMAKAKLLGFLDRLKVTGSTENPIAALIMQLQGTALKAGVVYDWDDDDDDPD